MEQLKALFISQYSKIPQDIISIRQAGSNRKYYRLVADGISVIGVENNDEKENKAFVEFSKHFKNNKSCVPEVIAVSDDYLCYLQQDLGSDNLFDMLLQERSNDDLIPEHILQLYKKSIQQLSYLQIVASKGLDYKNAHPVESFSKRSMKYDLNYFKYYFIKTTGVEFSEQALQDDVEKLTTFLEQAGTNYFMYRDFQARNIMVQKNEPFFIDYQGGRKGPLQYDIASLLFQAKAALPQIVRDELFAYYMECVKEHIDIDEELFTRYYHGFVLIRVLQTLGAYGLRGIIEKKPHFIQSIPYAINNLKFLIQETNVLDNYPELQKIIQQIINMKAFQQNHKPTKGKLHVRVISFSYHKGMPIDLSGNGGGFIFDCRSIHNPGRYAEHRQFTGRNKGVKEFLQTKSRANDFVKDALKMVEPAIQVYQTRKFTDLMICFGCTGGKHRSVYSADMLSELLKDIPNLCIETWHREQDILEFYNT